MPGFYKILSGKDRPVRGPSSPKYIDRPSRVHGANTALLSTTLGAWPSSITWLDAHLKLLCPDPNSIVIPCRLAFLPFGLRPVISACSSYGKAERADKNRVIAVADDDSLSQREGSKMAANCFAISPSQDHLGPRTCLFPCCSISKVLVPSVVSSTGRAKGRPRQTDSQSVAAHRPTEAVLPPAGAVSKGRHVA